MHQYRSRDVRILGQGVCLAVGLGLLAVQLVGAIVRLVEAPKAPKSTTSPQRQRVIAANQAWLQAHPRGQ